MHYTDNLQSDRLTTRFLTQGDVPAWTEFFTNAECTEFHANTSHLTPGELAQGWIDFTMARYKGNRYGMQALISKETGEFVGQCGLLAQEINGAPVIEVGYHLLRRHWGKGYASEAAKLFRDYGFESGIAGSIVSIIHPRNENSKRVALSNGMSLVQSDALFMGEPHNLFRITREEWSR